MIVLPHTTIRPFYVNNAMLHCHTINVAPNFATIRVQRCSIINNEITLTLVILGGKNLANSVVIFHYYHADDIPKNAPRVIKCSSG